MSSYRRRFYNMNLYFLKSPNNNLLVMAKDEEQAVRYFNYNNPRTPKVVLVAENAGNTGSGAPDDLEGAWIHGILDENIKVTCKEAPVQVRYNGKTYKESA